MRIALGIEYDGTPYCGWQSQAGGCAVQDAIQKSLNQITGEAITVIAAGRTDTGVHAMEQVVHFDTQVNRPMTAWVRGVNAFLPSSIVILWAHSVAEDFHARFSAQARSYSYYLYCRPVRSALYQGKVGWFHQQLDIEQMRAAAQFLLGEHDFSAFRASACQAKSPIKNLTILNIQEQEGMITLDLTANAFLHHMVRNIVGCLVYVGKGKHEPKWIQKILESGDRSLAAPTFAPDGLYFRRVKYETKWGLPQLE